MPNALVQALVEKISLPSWPDALQPLKAWLTDASTCTADAFGDDVAPWVEQVHREAKVGLDACELIRACRPQVIVSKDGRGVAIAPNPAKALTHAGALWFQWPRLQRSGLSAMGVRLGFRPALGQRTDGTWAYRADSMIEGQNAIDALCRVALRELAALGEVEPVTVEVDGLRVNLGEHGDFPAEPGALMTVRSGNLVTRVRAPARP